jgi:hypothetical protein
MRHMTGLIALNFVLLLALAQPVYSLSWKDKEWVDAGCPENISGYWIPRSVASSDGPTATVSKHQFTFPVKTGITEAINFEKLSESAIAIVLALDVDNLPTSEKIFPFLKIRPHLVSANVESGMKSLSQPECLIKVFRYQSQEHIQPNKYVNWDIYQIKTRK